MIKVLHFSPVKKANSIVSLHLKSLKDLLIGKNIDLTYSFYDDNVDKESSILLERFVEENKSILFKEENSHISLKEKRKSTIRWTLDNYERITIIKDYVINYFLKTDFDFLFLTDSDLILEPNTLMNLIDSRKDFCSTIFWTKFEGSDVYTPNCWYDKPKGFSDNDLMNFRKKGLYEVDFTGACTLLSRLILEKGVRFEKISNISYLGEDKHFCIRAAVNDFPIFVNTKSPAFHVYTENLIEEANLFLNKSYDLSYLDKWLDEKWEKQVKLIYGLRREKLKFNYNKWIKKLI